MLIDVKNSFGLTGIDAENILDSICITVNKNTIPYDQEKPTVTSGIRIGTPAVTTRGFDSNDAKEVADIIMMALRNKDSEEVLTDCKKKVLSLTQKYPLKGIK